MKNSKPVFHLLVPLLLLSLRSGGQTVTGTVTGPDGPVIGATISVSAGGGTATDPDGRYTLVLTADTSELTFRYLGFLEQTHVIRLADGQQQILDVQLAEAEVGLGEVVVVGSRTAPRSSTTSPLPVDILRNADLVGTGQPRFDQALQYRVPSFQTVQTPVNDATSLLDPYEIRNLGPSRTLVLVNGKRKNFSALLYTQTSPGRGETGADLSAIPVDAVERVEILRDGACAQYGSDAIAGVVNVILKGGKDQGGVTVRSGMTTAGDGETFGVALHQGIRLGPEDGFLHYTVDFSTAAVANRPGTVDAEGEAADFGADLSEVRAFLQEFPDARNINGTPETASMKFTIHASVPLGASVEGYVLAAYVNKKAESFANYRTPYWRTLTDYPYLVDFFGVDGRYIGYGPTFEGDLTDYHGTLGFRTDLNGWSTDASLTIGGNGQQYTVRQTHNGNGTLLPDGSYKYRENSPIIFHPGGTRFAHVVGNIDVTRRLTDRIGFAFGTECRAESFTVLAGDQASYEDGGADSFGGNDPRQAGRFNRYNFGGYADLALDLTTDFLLNATARWESYSDFGRAFVWKISSRYRLADNRLTFRGSVSTGFRAPLLHQLYTQKTQYSFVPGLGIQEGGLVSNVSREARLLGLPALAPESSLQLSVGLGVRPFPGLNLTLDYYDVAIDDRILLSTRIATTGGLTPLDQLLTENNLSDVSFFVNAMDTRTAGLDLVVQQSGIALARGTLAVQLSANHTLRNGRVGGVRNPGMVADAGLSVADATREALLFSSRPRYKAVLGIDYEHGRFAGFLGHTLFGPTRFKQEGLDEDLYTRFRPKLVTDISLRYRITEKASLALFVNNLADVLPSWEFRAENASGEAILQDSARRKVQSNLITFNQRYSRMTYDGYHFSQLGRTVAVSYTVRF